MLLPKDHPGIRFFAQFNVPAMAYELFMGQGDYRPEPIVMKRHEDDGNIVPPLLRLQMIEAQGLFDALWQAGLRPSNKANVDDVVAAKDENLASKDEHIADLRRIALREEIPKMLRPSEFLRKEATK